MTIKTTGSIVRPPEPRRGPPEPQNKPILKATYDGIPVHIFAFCEHGYSVMAIGVIVGQSRLLEFDLDVLQVPA